MSYFYQLDKIIYLVYNYCIISKYPEVYEKGKGDDTTKRKYYWYCLLSYCNCCSDCNNYHSCGLH